MLAPILDPAQRTLELARARRRAHTSSAQQDALVAEAAADIGRDDADLCPVEAEALGKAGAHDMRQLRRAP